MADLAPFPRPLQLRFAAVAWQVILHLALPLVVGLLLWRSRREPLYRARMRDRFGLGPASAPGAVWIFAASLGETRAVSPLIRALLAAGQRVHLTHSSPAGLQEGQNLFGTEIGNGQIMQGYMALDLFWAVHLFLRRNRPALGLIVESETWPAMLLGAWRARVPMVQVNGNLTERSILRAQSRIGAIRMHFFKGYQKVLTKSNRHVALYRRAGVDERRIHLVGELKFDQTIDPHHLSRAEEIRATWGPGRKTLMIASSVEDEEELLLGMLQTLLASPDAPRILWVPRSPQRFDALAKRLQALGYSVARRSRCLTEALDGTLPGDVDFLLGDSLGEMNFYYQLADLVFVGATLAPHGGHNIIEPLALGRPVVVGPSLFGIAFPVYEAIKAGAAQSLPDSAALGARISELLNTPAELTAMADAARGFCAFHKGAAASSMVELQPYLTHVGLHARAAGEADRSLILRWRNEQNARAMSLTSEEISAEAHKAWFSGALADPQRQLLMFEDCGQPVGHVRFDLVDDEAVVSVLLAPEARGRGLSKPILSAAMSACRFDTPGFRAVVRPQNTASLALFSGLGFSKTGTGDPLELFLDRKSDK